MAQFLDEDRCRTFHLDLGKETFQLKGKELMAYITKEVQLWREKGQFIQQREDKIREAALARETAEIELAMEAAHAALTRETAERELARETAEREAALAERAAARAHELDMTMLKVENGDQGIVVPEYQTRYSGDLVKWLCLHSIQRQRI